MSDIKENKLLEFLRKQIGQESYKSLSPYGQWLNGRIIAVENDSLSIAFKIRQDMTNPIGILHGGVIAGIIDDTIGMTVSCLGFDNYSVSVNLSMDFLSSGKVGDELTAKTRVIRQGNSLVNTECVVHNQQNKIIARGTANLFKTNIPKDLPDFL